MLAAGDLLDYVRFRAVCTSWRSGAASPRFHPRRWMMLPEGHGLYPGHPNLRGHARFLNLDTGALARARIPLLGDQWTTAPSTPSTASSSSSSSSCGTRTRKAPFASSTLSRATSPSSHP